MVQRLRVVLDQFCYIFILSLFTLLQLVCLFFYICITLYKAFHISSQFFIFVMPDGVCIHHICICDYVGLPWFVLSFHSHWALSWFLPFLSLQMIVLWALLCEWFCFLFLWPPWGHSFGSVDGSDFEMARAKIRNFSCIIPNYFPEQLTRSPFSTFSWFNGQSFPYFNIFASLMDMWGHFMVILNFMSYFFVLKTVNTIWPHLLGNIS